MSTFGVDLRGIIDLLSRHIYSGPEVYLRELIQNSRDAHQARAGHGSLPDPAWSIRLRPATAERPFTIIDDGIGMSATEVEELLATVGRSSKRDMLDMPDHDYLGHFGIGILSCFMVAQTIELVSRKEGEHAVHFRGHADGTFTVDTLDAAQTDALPIGTRVILDPLPDARSLLDEAGVRRLARRYAGFLAAPVVLERPDGTREALTEPAPFLSDDPAVRTRYGTELIGHEPLDTIVLDIPASGTRGVAYVLGSPASARTAVGARVHSGLMLLSESESSVVPAWAFFLRPVITSDLLTPTASRESLVKDDLVKATREGIAAAVRTWVRRLAESDWPLLRRFLAVHDQAIRAACVDDDELFRIVGPHLAFETAAGATTLSELARTGSIQFVTSTDEFRMLTGLESDPHLVDASYTHHRDLLLKAQFLYEGLKVSEADVMRELAALTDPPLDVRPVTSAFAATATAALTDVDVDVVIKVLPTPDVPSLYVADARVLTRMDLTRASEIATGPWAAALKVAAESLDEARERQGKTATRAQVCLNWASPVVRQLASLDDDVVVARSVRLLYVQALLAGRRPLTEPDRALMRTALTDLISLSVASHGGPDTPGGLS